MLLAKGGENESYEICESTIFFVIRLAFRKHNSTRAQSAEALSSQTNLEKEKHPTPTGSC
jgi:hypothetical protein